MKTYDQKQINYYLKQLKNNTKTLTSSIELLDLYSKKIAEILHDYTKLESDKYMRDIEYHLHRMVKSIESLEIRTGQMSG